MWNTAIKISDQFSILFYYAIIIIKVRHFPRAILRIGNFPRIFSQVETSQEYSPKWYLSKCALFQVAKFPSFFLAAALCPLAHPSISAPPPCIDWAPKKTLPNLWEVATWEFSHFGSCNLGNRHLGSRLCDNSWTTVTLFFSQKALLLASNYQIIYLFCVITFRLL